MSAELELAGRVARHVRRVQRAQWADLAELRASAVVAIVEAGRQYTGDDAGRPGYLWCAGTYAATRALRQGQAAVHISKHRLDLGGACAGVELKPHHAVGDATDAEHYRREIVRRVRAVVSRLIGDRDGAHLALLLAGEATSAELAQVRGEPVAETYRWRERTVARLRRCAELESLWTELEAA